VYQELRREASWHEAPIGFYHYRDRDGAEVDIVLERGVNELAGIEVKAAATVTEADFRGLRKFQAAAGERFVGRDRPLRRREQCTLRPGPVRGSDPGALGAADRATV